MSESFLRGGNVWNFFSKKASQHELLLSLVNNRLGSVQFDAAEHRRTTLHIRKNILFVTIFY